MVRVFWEGDTQTELEVEIFSVVMLLEGQKGRLGQGDTCTWEGEGLRWQYSSGKSWAGPWLLQSQGCSEEPELAGGGKPCSLLSSIIAGDDGRCVALGSEAEANPIGSLCRWLVAVYTGGLLSGPAPPPQPINADHPCAPH